MRHENKFNLPIKLIEEANKCTKNHACLKDPNYQLCGAAITTDSGTERMVCSHGSKCPYNSTLGNKHVCTCPIRQEIYRKYGI
jgi:hypothetical protein